jgi:predicted RNase H-like nuclease (RuvC/YqgF family)
LASDFFASQALPKARIELLKAKLAKAEHENDSLVIRLGGLENQCAARTARNANLETELIQAHKKIFNLTQELNDEKRKKDCLHRRYDLLKQDLNGLEKRVAQVEMFSNGMAQEHKRHGKG